MSRSIEQPPLRRLARKLLDQLPENLALPILSGPLRGKLWVLHSANYSCWMGTYEQAKQNAFVAALHPGSVILDIGAHVGFYSLLAAVRTGPTGRVYAFEPLDSNLRYLRRHAALNRSSIEVLEVAVADRDAQSHFQAGESSYTGRLGDAGQLTNVVSLDTICAAGRVPKPDLMKIDVEGAEALVLRGAIATIQAARPTIFLAVHGPAVRDLCLSLLSGLGYRCDVLSGEGIEADAEYVCLP